MKKILFLIFIVSMVLLFSYILADTKIYYLNLNTLNSNDYSIYYSNHLEKLKKLEYYNNNFNVIDYRITDLINMIESNKKIDINGKKQTIENALIKADVITVWVGMNELNYKINTSDINELYNYSDTILMDMEKLFLLLRKYSKEKIIFLNFYNSGNMEYDEVINYLNNKMNALALEYNIDILDISHLIDKKITDENNKEIASKLEEI